MRATESIIKMAKENNGTVTTAMVVTAGFSRGNIKYLVALFLWDLTDRTPNRYYMTFPANYNLTKPKEENIRCVQCKKALYDFGIAEVTTPGGNTVRAYSIERTLCDILRPHSRVDIQIVTEVFKRYAARSIKG